MATPKKTTETPSTARPRSRATKKTLIAQAFERPPEEANPEPAAHESSGDVIRVRRLHRRDLKRVWEFLKRVFRDVNQKTVELQRPRSRRSFEESYDNEGIEQLVFEHGSHIVGYAECTYEVTGADNWVNWRWFDNRDMRPLFVEELAVDPDYQGRGVGSFMLEQLRHSGSLRGCTHLVLEVAENNEEALQFYRKRNFFKIDAAIFLAQRIDRQPELLPPKPLKPAKPEPSEADKAAARAEKRAAKQAKTAKASDEAPRKPKKAPARS
jgi:ribosomal protein S18 acetylase RimI-like enzyme